MNKSIRNSESSNSNKDHQQNFFPGEVKKCLHPDTTQIIRRTPNSRIFEEMCDDCGAFVKKFEEHISPVKGVIDEYPGNPIDETIANGKKPGKSSKMEFGYFYKAWLAGKPVGGL